MGRMRPVSSAGISAPMMATPRPVEAAVVVVELELISAEAMPPLAKDTTAAPTTLPMATTTSCECTSARGVAENPR